MITWLIFFGTVRKGNKSQYVLEFIKEMVKERKDVEFEVVDPREMDLKFDDEGESAGPQWLKDKVAAADGYIIVTPEYNHGYPASLKHVLDMCYKEYFHKPVGIVTVSSGPFAGVRCMEVLLHVVRELGLVSLWENVHVERVKENFSETGPKDRETWAKRVNGMLKELMWMTRVLKHGREEIEQKN